MNAYKAFNSDMTCRGFQYKEGETYKMDGEVKLCKRGFHACENPIDCLRYYIPSGSVYHEVELDDVTDEKGNDTKRVGKKITIGARVSLASLTKFAVDFIFKEIDWNNAKESNTGDYSAATNTGNHSAATNTGYQSAAEVSGLYSVAIATGYKSKVKGKKGCAIVCVERGEWNGNTYPLLCVKADIVDGERIKKDVWYTVENGEWKEVN